MRHKTSRCYVNLLGLRLGSALLRCARDRMAFVRATLPCCVPAVQNHLTVIPVVERPHHHMPLAILPRMHDVHWTLNGRLR
jgi:hypothetical protein